MICANFALNNLVVYNKSPTFAISFCITLNFVHMEKTMIPEDNSVESIKVREQIIRDFYREWKEKNPSQRRFNLSLKEYINIRMVSERMMIMTYELNGIGTVKMTVGIRRRTKEKVQYCITAISST